MFYQTELIPLDCGTGIEPVMPGSRPGVLPLNEPQSGEGRIRTCQYRVMSPVPIANWLPLLGSEYCSAPHSIGRVQVANYCTSSVSAPRAFRRVVPLAYATEALIHQEPGRATRSTSSFSSILAATLSASRSRSTPPSSMFSTASLSAGS